MKCQCVDCTNEGTWRPIVRFFAPRPLKGSFTAEIGISVCAPCKEKTALRDLVTPEFEQVTVAALKRMKPGSAVPDLTRTALEWIPAAESDLRPAQATQGGPVAEHILISDKPDEIASARKHCEHELTIVAPGRANLDGLCWWSVKNPPAYRCEACAGNFKHPLLRGGDVAVVVFGIHEEHVMAMLLHERCWRARLSPNA